MAVQPQDKTRISCCNTKPLVIRSVVFCDEAFDKLGIRKSPLSIDKLLIARDGLEHSVLMIGGHLVQIPIEIDYGPGRVGLNHGLNVSS
jgi:hypothetical protein